jgi:hypothetical protein
MLPLKVFAMAFLSCLALASAQTVVPTACFTVKCSAGYECVVNKNGLAGCQPIAVHTCPCPKIFNPVCCKLKSGITQSVSNRCLCTCKGNGAVIGRGKCTPIGDCICTTEYKPVCCSVGGGSPFTASNSCSCTCQGKGNIEANGPCTDVAASSITCANVRCAGPCLDTPKGPRCQPRSAI